MSTWAWLVTIGRSSPWGLAFILAFIGLELILEAAHHHGLSWAPEIPILVSLGVIIGTLAVTTAAGLVTSRRDELAAAEQAERAAQEQAAAAAEPIGRVDPVVDGLEPTGGKH